MFWLKFLGVAVAMATVDWCWARYISTIAGGKSFAAAWWSTTIVVLGALAVVSYVEDKRLLIAAGIGAWVGTFYSVKRGGPK